ncbi:uncharacterized protein [Typha latifolia]|uniref:uncharacterized protein isoform X1 n=1 Tax=Typha latifolia TaxID=4733 RepID=UPI003C2C3E41
MADDASYDPDIFTDLDPIEHGFTSSSPSDNNNSGGDRTEASYEEGSTDTELEDRYISNSQSEELKGLVKEFQDSECGWRHPLTTNVKEFSDLVERASNQEISVDNFMWEAYEILAAFPLFLRKLDSVFPGFMKWEPIGSVLIGSCLRNDVTVPVWKPRYR